MSKFNLTRKELYDLVWSEPLTVVAKKYNTSDYVLRATCKKFNIPLPKAGHWMKLQFGKPVDIEDFDESYDGPEQIPLIDRPINEDTITVSASPLMLLKAEIENDRNISLTVPDKLVNPDRLITAVKEALTGKHAYSGDGNIIKAWDQLKIYVTKENLGRALRFMDTFIKAIKARKHDIMIKNRETYILIYGEKIKVSCREKTKRIVVPGTYSNHTELRATGILTFNIDGYHGKEWKDGKLKIEDQLSTIIAKIEIEGNRLKVATEERERYWAEDAEKKQIVEDIQKQREKELEEFKTMIKHAKKHREVVMLREYILAVKEKAIRDEKLTEELKNWIQWAQDKINWYDPLVNQHDPKWEEVDKDTLTFIRRNSWII
jgi:hypothetical protein